MTPPQLPRDARPGQPTQPPPGPSRRDVLRLGGGAAVAAVLAACSSKGGTKPPVSATPTPSPSTPPTLAGLSAQLSTPLLLPGSAGYNAHRLLYNPRFDATARPAAIAMCQNPKDVVACVRFGAAGGAPLALRAGGHSYGGWSTGSGLVVDVTSMSSVTVDTSNQVARVGAGAQLAEVYETLGGKGVAIGGGSCPTVGITGLAQGGGVGVLTRSFGLTCDQVQSVQVVTADGQLREVDGSHDSDLFWALRGGGGGSFGVVTAFTVTVRPAPTVHTFFLSWPDTAAASVLTAWQHWIGGTDRRLWSTCKLLADPGSGLRAVVAGTWTGPSSQLDNQLAGLLGTVGTPAATDSRHTLGYVDAMMLEAGCSGESAQTCIAQALSPSKRQPFAATSAILSEPLPPAGVDAAVSVARAGLQVPGAVEAGMSFDALGGVVGTVDAAATAFVHRRALATVQLTTTWPSSAASADPAPFDAHVQAERSALQPWTGTAAYVNYIDPAITDYGDAYWGANYARLRSVKRQVDPHRLFDFPQAVQP